MHFETGLWKGTLKLYVVLCVRSNTMLSVASCFHPPFKRAVLQRPEWMTNQWKKTRVSSKPVFSDTPTLYLESLATSAGVYFMCHVWPPSGSDCVDPEDPTVIAETELLGAAASIEAAAKKLEQLKPRAKPKVWVPLLDLSTHTSPRIAFSAINQQGRRWGA